MAMPHDTGADKGFALPLDAPDRDLVVRAHEGDLVAALALIARYAEPLFNVVHRATGMTAVAEDVVRDTLSSAVGGLAERVPPGDQRWIVALAAEAYRQLMATGLRPEQPAQRVRISPRHWDAGRLEIAAEARAGARRTAQKLRQRLWRAWSALCLEHRFVLALSETAATSVAELAEVLGRDEAAARVTRDQAKLALMSRLTSERLGWKSWLEERRRRNRP